LVIWFVVSCPIQCVLASVLKLRWYLIPTVLLPLSGLLLFAYTVWATGPFGRQTDAYALFYVLGGTTLAWASIAWLAANILGFFGVKPLYERARRHG
jgi:hypothetical protein